ncbi:3825_t:CDS:1 [Ambispora gerdemannii]|uniref:3825_t:CDS:1 n=1 Tax=Ambispora gerdemannii TaxID=144530 RepID=A0A9N9H445_9GLOM|nr:3825_t:CDS:1 [Ambispora gerdemannii]
MSNIYGDFFARSHIGENPEIIRQGTLTQSPDIQPAGTKPITNPHEHFIGGGDGIQFNVDKGTKITETVRNYIYIRGASVLPSEGYVELYFVPKTLILHPNDWSKNQLKDEKGNTRIKFNAPAYGKIVLSTPFVWDHPVGNQHCCLVSRIVTKEHPNDRHMTPFKNIDDFNNWLKNSPGIGWRNIEFVNPSLPTYTTTTDLQIHPDWATHDALIYLETVDIPNGVTVSFESSNIDPPFKLEPQKVTSKNQKFLILTQLKSGAKGKVTYTYHRNGIEVHADAKLILHVAKLSILGNVNVVFKHDV